MYIDDGLIKAIREKDIENISMLFFNKQQKSINPNYRTENELWDFKSCLPDYNGAGIEWAETSKDILSFYNAKKGGLIIYGVEDLNFRIQGLSQSQKIDSKIFNDKIRKYIGDKIWIEFFRIDLTDDLSIGIVVIPPAIGGLCRFLKNGPEKKKKCLFLEDGSAIRKHDSSIILSPQEANSYILDNQEFTNQVYEIDEPCYRLLSKDYFEFVHRPDYCDKIIKGLKNSRISVVTLTGIGGVGKTALAVWAVKDAYKSMKYDYIISITAKDRELVSTGIQPINQYLTTFEDLIDSILDVIGLPDLKKMPREEKESNILDLIVDTNMLLFIDNLETAADAKLIEFLNNLPEGVQAIVTSRINLIRFSSYPIEVNVLEPEEVITFIDSLSKIDRYSYCKALSRSEKDFIGSSCNRIPLAIRWMVGRCGAVDELIKQAEMLKSYDATGAELLEFSFRRIFENMSICEKDLMQLLAIVGDIPIEAIMVATGAQNSDHNVIDVLEKLVRDTIIIKYYDRDLNGYKYKLLSLVSNFIVSKFVTIENEKKFRTRLTKWYNADDIKDEREKLIYREMRQKGKNVGNTLIQLAEVALREGREDAANQLFGLAIQRDPSNWKVYRAYAEYYRHFKKSQTKTIEYYKLAIEYAEKQSPNSDVAILFREYAMLYSQSGYSDIDEVLEKYLAVAYELLPNDPITAKYYGEFFLKKGRYYDCIKILEGYENTTDRRTMECLWPMLLKSLEQTGNNLVRSISLKRKMESEGVCAYNR